MVQKFLDFFSLLNHGEDSVAAHPSLQWGKHSLQIMAFCVCSLYFIYFYFCLTKCNLIQSENRLGLRYWCRALSELLCCSISFVCSLMSVHQLSSWTSGPYWPKQRYIHVNIWRTTGSALDSVAVAVQGVICFILIVMVEGFL